MSERKYGESMMTLIIGGAIGACLGVLLAPQSGKETRDKVKSMFDDLEGETGDIVEESLEKIEEIARVSKKAVKNRKK